ncbi:MAG: hypothetical protein KKE12_19720 [Proteobacteria bacterium]|nr:hypothetical protein [Pseudomonadota bacterium]
MNKEKSKREQEANLRRAIIAAKSEYFSWTEEEQEKYRAQRKLKDDFMFYKIIFMELFGFKAETQEELDKLVPNKYVRGKNHGNKQKGGGYFWDHRVDAIEKEKELARKFVHDAYKDVMENYDSRIVKFKKKSGYC